MTIVKNYLVIGYVYLSSYSAARYSADKQGYNRVEKKSNANVMVIPKGSASRYAYSQDLRQRALYILG